MEDEIEAAVQDAIAPLKQEIKALKAQLAELAPLVQMAKAALEPPATVKEAQAILNAIPKEIVRALGIAQVGFDPKSVWFKLVRNDGTTISVKKAESGFRIRVRDQAGVLLKELNAPFNGLNAALKSLL
jgi:hypothetical protein